MRWLDVLVAHAHENLTGNREREALWSRGVVDAQISEFQIGYLKNGPPSLDATADDFLAWARRHGLKDVFVFPLTNSLGQVKGVQFRHVERHVKGYIDYFLAKDEPAFFGLSQAMPHIWKTQTVCLVEGAFDLFPVQRIFPHTVPTMTSSVSTTFLRFLRRNVREVWFGYDSDAAGQDGAREFVKQHRHEFDRVIAPHFPKVKFVDGKRAKDPADLWEVMGDERLGVYLKSAFEQR